MTLCFPGEQEDGRDGRSPGVGEGKATVDCHWTKWIHVSSGVANREGDLSPYFSYSMILQCVSSIHGPAVVREKSKRWC